MTTFVRRDIWTLAPDDPIVASYAAGVDVMRRRPASDPTSWAYQAAIHGTHAASPPPLANGCRHQSWYFLPWHRMYLFFFEQIVRAAVIETGGPSDWALPYWNYGLNGRNATLPLAFRSPTLDDGTDNPLFVAERNFGVNEGGTIPPEITSAARALARTRFTGTTEFGGGVTGTRGQFFGETGELEQTPHNDIHGILGGADGWMRDPDLAAQDPIFWLHHANIDRIWDLWNATGNANPGETDWSDASFDFFDADARRASRTCAAVRDVADLGYAYDARPTPPPAPPGDPERLESMAMSGSNPGRERELVGASEEAVQLVGAPAKVSVPIDTRARESFLESLPSAEARPRRVFLHVDDIEAERNPGTVYGVYVNLPDDASADQAPAHHAGNVSFFGVERTRNPRGDEPGHGLRATMDITALANDLAARNAWDDERLDVTFRPLGLIAPEQPGPQLEAALRPQARREDPPVRIGRVSVFYG